MVVTSYQWIWTALGYVAHHRRLPRKQDGNSNNCGLSNTVSRDPGLLLLRGLDTGVLTSTLHQTPGLTTPQQCMRRGVYGNNEIVVPPKGFLTLLGLKALNPFYVFQLFSFCLWILDDYVYYAMVCVLFISPLSISWYKFSSYHKYYTQKFIFHLFSEQE